LSKALLKVVENRGTSRKDPKKWKGIDKDWTLYDLLDWTFLYLTGRWMEGGAPEASLTYDFLENGCPCLERGIKYEKPLLGLQLLQDLELQVFLPKGTLLGGGVSLTTCGSFLSGPETSDASPYRSTLKIHDIRIPTLIGVNANERLARQWVIATVEIDPYTSCHGFDRYNELEQIVVKVYRISMVRFYVLC
jgi:hypothetical protein